MKESIRAELEETRAAYHALLARLTEEDWRRSSANPAWTAGNLMWHVAWVAGMRPFVVGRARRGRSFNPPEPIFGWSNVLITRWTGRKATPAAAAARYEAAHAATLRCLADVREDEWGQGGMIFRQHVTVEFAFRFVSAHFAEHAAQISLDTHRV